MELFKKIWIPLAGVIISSCVIYTEFKGITSFGHLINMIFKCQQDPANSAPCYLLYDIYVVMFMIIIFIATITVAIMRVSKYTSDILSNK